MNRYTLLTIAIMLMYAVVTPGFQCERGRPVDCTSYVQDTAIFPFSVLNNGSDIHVLDTVKLNSFVSDTIHSVKGRSFVYQLNTLYSSIQLYKVVTSGGGAVLNYANIEFNPVITEGQFDNMGYPGVNYLFNRLSPYNRLQGGFVAGSPGLYLAILNTSNYSGYNIYESNDYCHQYTGVYFVPEAQQQKQYWDVLGLSSIRLSSSNNYIVANKGDKNYFFMNVLP